MSRARGAGWPVWASLAVLLVSVASLAVRQQDDAVPASAPSAALSGIRAGAVAPSADGDPGAAPVVEPDSGGRADQGTDRRPDAGADRRADRSTDRNAPRSYDVARGSALRPKHPAFYALSLRMAQRGYELRKSPLGPSTSFTVSSFNVLGAGHTSARGGMASGVARMHAAVGLLVSHGVSVAGLQEFQEPQYHVFEALVGGTYDTYPGLSMGSQPVQNSIIWRQSDWSLVEAHTVPIPYFHGNRVPMPYVLLRNRHTGREVWFYNSHNPADAYGPAGHWRAVATSIEANLARTLTADGTPMIVTGDMNDRAPFACPFASATGMHSADGAYYAGGCHLPRQTNVDWIFGSGSLDFSSFVTDRSSQTRRISDHPMVRSAVTVPAVADPRCRKAGSFGWFCPQD